MGDSFGLSINKSYEGGPCATSPGVRSWTLGDRIDQAVAESAQRLQAAQRARELLDKNPEIEELVNLLGRF